MKHIGKTLILISLIFCIAGCKTTGYKKIIETASISYSDLLQIETILMDKGFQIVAYKTEKGDMAEWKEKNVEHPRYPNEVYTFLLKKLSDEAYWFVDVYVYYVKDIQNNTANHVQIDVGNIYKGLIVPEIKAEIDSIGDLLYQDLANKVGKEKVTIERREWGPPVIY
ncbi:MAG: hypothetical protein NG784_15445 [Candidatus Jettenia sp.]|nr:hypothetical protein [Candidatus Jettenia sp.]